jgi:hypothetical protein
MSTGKKNIKLRFAVTLIVLLVLHLLQGKYRLIGEGKLEGDFPTPPNAPFTFKDWFSGDYQKHKETYLNSSFGFRDYFVRVNNQVAFTLFKKAKANFVVAGKHNYLYEVTYINSYLGLDFIGKDSIMHRLERVKFLTDTLAKLNKNLILVFAAGKGSFYPEFFPAEFYLRKGITNYDYYTRFAKAYGLKYIDFNSSFIKNKHNSPYPLFPQYGIHWSHYGMCVVIDSLIKYIEQARHIDMPNFYWKEVELKKACKTDYDIAYGMNIIFKLKRSKMAYPVLKMESDTSKVKPSVLVIADSYYWGIFNYVISAAFDKSHFWYYNKQIYPESFNKPLTTDQVNLRNEIASHDVIIILATDANLPAFGWGFIENCYNLFKIKVN